MNKKGFTLVELLVVIAIIGLLSTIAVVSLSGARNKAVASKIVADLRTVQTALEAFATDNNGYPASLAGGWSALSLGTYMPTMPTPTGGGGYTYCVNGSYYLLAASTTVTGVKPAGLSTANFSGGGASGKCGVAVSATWLNCGSDTVYCLTNTSTAAVNAWQ